MAPQTPEQPRLSLELASAIQREPLTHLDNLMRQYPEVAEQTLESLRKGREAVIRGQRQQKIAEAIGAALDVTDGGKRLNGFYDDKTFDNIISDTEDYPDLLRARTEGVDDPSEANQQIAYFGLLVYTRRIIEASRSPVPEQATRLQTDRIAA